MSTDTNRTLTGRRVVIVSNYLPAVGVSGHRAYLATIVGGLLEIGFRVEIALVDTWPGPVVDSVDRGVKVRGPGVAQFRRQVVVVGPGAMARNVAASVAGFAPSTMRRRLIQLRDQRRGRRQVDHVVLQPLRSRSARWLQDHLERTRPDIVIVNGHSLGTDWCPAGVRLVAIAHDSILGRVESLLRAGYRTVPPTFDRASERELIARCSAITAIQPAEREYFEHLVPTTSVVWLPPGLPRPTSSALSARPNTVLFVGSISLHNVDGIRWFVDSVWPTILQQEPRMRLRLVGTVCDRLDIDHPNIDVLGRIDDLTAEYALASVVVAPLRIGSGLKIKTIEALVHGCRVVATKIGAEGLEGLIGVEVDVVDDSDGFAQTVVRVASEDDGLAQRTTRSERALELFGQEALRRVLAELLSEAVDDLVSGGGRS